MHSEDVAIFWDYENCHAASSFTGYEVVKKIRCVAHNFGTVKLFKAYLELSDPATFSKSLALRSELQSSGVSLTDCPHNGRKDVADKMMLVDMLAYAIDNSAPSTIVLISGDRDFAYAVSILRLRRYRVVIICLPTVHISLKVQASIFLDWNTDVLGAKTVDDYLSPRIGTLSSSDDRGPPISHYPSELLSMGRNHTAVPLHGTRFDVEEESDVDIMDHLHTKTNGVRRPRTLTTDKNTYAMEDPSRDTQSYAPPRTPFLRESHQDELTMSESILGSSSRTESAAALYMDNTSQTPTVVNKPINAARTNGGLGSAAQEPSARASPHIPVRSFMNPGSIMVPNQDPKPLSMPATPDAGPNSPPLGRPPPPSTAQLHLPIGTMSSTSIIPSQIQPVVQGNAPAASIVEQSEPRVVPPIFKLLVQRLESHRSKGLLRPFRSVVALALATQDNTLYRRAGVERFGQYVAIAEKLGIVELGGKEGGAWIALRPDWYNAKIS